MPLGQLEARLGELDAWRRKRIVIHCHHGGRSARACALLRDRGFERVENLAGGIDAWSLSVDPERAAVLGSGKRGARMAKSLIPDPLRRRHLVERELPPAQALKLAEAYLARGARCEAIDFLRKAGAHERLAALRAEAVAAGDGFLLRVVASALGEPPTADTLARACGAREAAGKERYAAEARRQSERGEE